MRTYLLNVLPLLAGIFSQPVHADLALHITDAAGAESRIYVQSGQCRIEVPGVSGYTLINTRDHALIHVDTAKREYSTMTEAQLNEQLDRLDAVRKSLSPHMEALRGSLQMLPADQRAQLEQYIAGAAAPSAGSPVTLHADGGLQNFAGLVCAHQRLLQGQRQVGDACLLQQPSGKLAPDDYNTLITAMALTRELSGRVGGLLTQAGNKRALLAPDIHGLPIALRDYVSGESYRVTTAGNAPLDRKLFDSYREYRQVEAKALPGLF